MLAEVYESHGDFANAEKYSTFAADAGHVGALILVANMRMLQGDFETALLIAADIDIGFGQDGDLAVKRVNAYRDTAHRASFFDTLEADPEDIFPIFFLAEYANLGRIDDAFSIASDPGSFIFKTRFILWRHDMSRFRRDPRFLEIVAAANYVDYWNEYGWPPACAPTGDTIVCQ